MANEVLHDMAGTAAQIKKIWEKHIPGLSTRRRGESAVVIPLIMKGGRLHILFEKRASDLKIQPGEVCFPGGHLEVGETLKEAAIRETCEELLVREDQIEILAALDPSMGPSGASVWPFAALIRDYKDTWSRDEVDYVFSVPFEDLKDQVPECYKVQLATVPGEDFPFERIPGGKDYPWRSKENPIYFYSGGPETIWGVTARMLYEFLKIYNEYGENRQLSTT